jgi:hypothetical protein
MDINAEHVSRTQIAAVGLVLENSDTNSLVGFSSIVFLRADGLRRLGLVAAPTLLDGAYDKSKSKFAKSVIRPFVGELDYWARRLPGGVPVTHSASSSGVTAAVVHKKVRNVDWVAGQVELGKFKECWHVTFPWMRLRASKEFNASFSGHLYVEKDFFQECLDRLVDEELGKDPQLSDSPSELVALPRQQKRHL